MTLRPLAGRALIGPAMLGDDAVEVAAELLQRAPCQMSVHVRIGQLSFRKIQSR